MGFVKNSDAKLLAANGMDNHIHVLVMIRPKLAIADLVRAIKSNTSNWIHETYSTHNDFAWQKGYSVFSVSMSSVDSVASYIARRQEHHKKQTFEEEVMTFLKKHNLEYDERFVFEE